MMVENDYWLLYLLSLSCGMLLGFVYFGGLWLTIQKIVIRSKNAHVIVLFSYLIRVAITLLGFYFILKLGLIHTLVAFLSFFITRQLLMHKLGKAEDAYGN